MKPIKALLFVGLLLGTGACTIPSEDPVKVESITLSPTGGDTDSLTATIQAKGQGSIRVEWWGYYDTTGYHLLETDYLNITDTTSYYYTATYTQDSLLDGYYWVEIWNDTTELASTNQTVHYGSGPTVPPSGVRLVCYRHANSDSTTLYCFFEIPGAYKVGVTYAKFDARGNNDWWEIKTFPYYDGLCEAVYHAPPSEYRPRAIIFNKWGCDTITTDTTIKVQ